MTINGEKPTRPEDALPLSGTGKEGRGSCVLFNPATLIQSSETGFPSIAAAKAAKAIATTNYEEDMEEYLHNPTMISLPPLRL